jgi:hypothetical protein
MRLSELAAYSLQIRQRDADERRRRAQLQGISILPVRLRISEYLSDVAANLEGAVDRAGVWIGRRAGLGSGLS